MIDDIAHLLACKHNWIISGLIDFGMSNKPMALSSAEIEEIAAMEDIQQMWGAESAAEMAQWLDADIRAVKFPNYTTDGPGYSGELYLLMGGDLAPLILIRKKGKLLITETE